jgi:hypothetical protein
MAFAVGGLFVVGSGALGTVGTLRFPVPAQTPLAVLAPFEDLERAASDGTLLRGWFYPRMGAVGAVLLLHGYHQDAAQMAPLVPDLRERGLAALALDFRAHGRSDGHVVSFGLREAADVVVGLEAIRERTGLPRDRIAVVGVSMGAAAALIASRDLEGIAGACLIAPFSTLEGTIDRRFRIALGIPARPFGSFAIAIGEAIGGYAVSDVRPIDRAAGFAGIPLLLLGGTDDDRVPPPEMESFRDAAGSRADLMILPSLDHFELGDFERSEVSDPILGFCDRTLGSPAAAIP